MSAMGRAMSTAYDHKAQGDQTLLVTGATGSFGQAFVRHALEDQTYARIVVYSRDELKQSEMRDAIPDPDGRLRFRLGDVRDLDRLRRAFDGVNLVVHAAALKQVGALEHNPIEAVKTNVLGTANVIEAAIDADVSKVVGLTTDKACEPVNLYGATKLCAEKLLVSAGDWCGHRVAFVALRYGNVLGSRGSVVPRWRAQAARGETLAGTCHGATRFFWSLADAVAFAWKRAHEDLPRGAVCVPRMGGCEMHRIATRIAESPAGCPNSTWVQWSGEMRPGEKLHETLVSQHERYDVVPWGYLVHEGGGGRGQITSAGATPITDEKLEQMLRETL